MSSGSGDRRDNSDAWRPARSRDGGQFLSTSTTSGPRPQMPVQRDARPQEEAAPSHPILIRNGDEHRLLTDKTCRFLSPTEVDSIQLAFTMVKWISDLKDDDIAQCGPNVGSQLWYFRKHSEAIKPILLALGRTKVPTWNPTEDATFEIKERFFGTPSNKRARCESPSPDAARFASDEKHHHEIWSNRVPAAQLKKEEKGEQRYQR